MPACCFWATVNLAGYREVGGVFSLLQRVIRKDAITNLFPFVFRYAFACMGGLLCSMTFLNYKSKFTVTLLITEVKR